MTVISSAYPFEFFNVCKWGVRGSRYNANNLSVTIAYSWKFCTWSPSINWISPFALSHPVVFDESAIKKYVLEPLGIATDLFVCISFDSFPPETPEGVMTCPTPEPFVYCLITTLVSSVFPRYPVAQDAEYLKQYLCIGCFAFAMRYRKFKIHMPQQAIEYTLFYQILMHRLDCMWRRQKKIYCFCTHPGKMLGWYAIIDDDVYSDR